ncbi:hypothetical protein AMTRI_Chr03g44580 [Amborella trichopoda]
MTTLYFTVKPRPIYLVDYTCYKPSDSCRLPISGFLERARLLPSFDIKSIKLHVPILERPGFGGNECVPPHIHCTPPVLDEMNACLLISLYTTRTDHGQCSS